MIRNIVFVVLFCTSFLYSKVINGIDLKPNTTYKNISLKRANLSGLNLKGVTFFNSDLTGAKFNNTNLSEAIIKRSKLDKAKFNGADLSHAKLDYSSFKKAIISGANLQDASIQHANFSLAKITNTDARRANFHKSKFLKTKIIKLDARKANFTNTVFIGIDIKDSKFWSADFRYFAIKDVVFKNCGLQEAKFNKQSIIKNMTFENSIWTDKSFCEDKGFLYCLKEGISIYK